MPGEALCKKKYWIAGLIGCLCFGAGDWLLGYVDPASAGEDLFYFIRAGHGADYNTARAAVTMALAMAGMPFYLSGMVHLADIAPDDKTKGRLQHAFGLCAVGWLSIHFLVAVNVLVYSWASQHAGAETADAVSNFLGNALLPCLCLAYAFAGIPLILLLLCILRGKTALEKREIIFTPLIGTALIGIGAGLLPASAFSYGLYTFCMNGGMLVWFLYLLARRPVLRRK